MKKTAAILICLIIIFSFSACGGNTQEGGTSSVDSDAPITTVNIIENVTGGVIPELEGVSLGSTMGDVRAKYSGKDLKLGDATYYTLSYDTDFYYMDKSSFGVLAIVTSGKAFGIEKGTAFDKVADYMATLDNCFPANTNTPSDWAKTAVSDAVSAQVYLIGENNIEFIFDENGLIATAIYEK